MTLQKLLEAVQETKTWGQKSVVSRSWDCTTYVDLVFRDWDTGYCSYKIQNLCV